MTSQELRASFVEYFVSNGHAHLPAATLVPPEMSTTLFTIAGMEQFVPVFLGEAPTAVPRAVTVQRCLRVAGAKSDIENVGRTGRHGTFLEMLGNFSFGDYYKREAILFAWEYLTERLRLPAERLHVTVHTSDEEAQRLWEQEIGLRSSRITYFDEENFWTMGATGPCGPSTEIFVDTGAENASGPHDTGPNAGDRFLEIWNLVFQQFNRTADGSLKELPRKNIDTGAGFERVLAVANGKASMYDTDLFLDLIAAQPDVGETPLDDAEQLVRRRIIADHARAVTFIIADGIAPSNTDRGYVLRFLIRRAIRNGRLLGYPRGFLTPLVPAVVRSLGPGYPELIEARPRVEQTLGAEERAFDRTLERGMEMVAGLLDAAKASGTPLAGTDIFTLHDTYGFPSELTREIAAEQGIAVDLMGFEHEMEEQRRRGREDALRKRPVVVAKEDVPAARAATTSTDGGSNETQFTGYQGLETDATLLAIVRDGAHVEGIEAGAEADLILDRTSFYAEKGGQIGDRGTISSDGAAFDVTDTQFLGNGKRVVHRGSLVHGMLRVGQRVHAAVAPQWREEIRREHTSVHLLQRALKEIVGEDVVQRGSWVGIDRQRFDFSGPSLTPEQRAAVQRRVNELIRADYHREVIELPIDEARKTGAITMAGEDYGDRVRVVSFGPSKEFCGGTHAETSGELGTFIIVSESSIGSGIRRIESIVSRSADAYIERQQNVLASLSEALSTKPEELAERIARLQNETREAQKAAAELRSRVAAADADAYVKRAETIAGRQLVAAVVPDVDADALRTLGNAIRSRLRTGIIALAGVQNGSVSLFVTVSDDLTKSGVHAGNLVKTAAPLVDGKGGGAPGQAQGGGKKPEGAEAALGAIRTALGA
ncbi:MAG: alanine--tRNA ligase [Candidatus Eremiobacteraeota bacterium]|nr:alanine--tRNA ligase [Candidatus Eremiobacteraeota bacterium]